MRRFFRALLVLSLLLSSCAFFEKEHTETIRILHTSDVHGCFYTWDFINQKPSKGSLEAVSGYVRDLRSQADGNVILLDGGDLLQGQPGAYYYNYMDTVSSHLAADMLRYIGYDASVMGNHDVETGSAVFNRWREDCGFPVLGANIVDAESGEPAFDPYTVIRRKGVRIAVLGLITEAIPAWLSEDLWKGLRFEDMEETARKWIPIIQKKEKPDVIVGLFHAGRDSTSYVSGYKENPTLEIAAKVDGFDIIFYGHDHSRNVEKAAGPKGDSVLLVDPGSNAHYLSDVTLRITKKGGKVLSKDISGELVPLDGLTPDKLFQEAFMTQKNQVDDFVGRKIGHLGKTIRSRDAFFAPSAFEGLIHNLQLQITKADISITAPLSFDTEIREGDLYVSDMFNLYKYENMLYTVSLKGSEIKDALESSYDDWIVTMTKPQDHILKISDGQGKGRFIEPTYNFDSAAGINYTVDVTKPKGERVRIECLSDGRPFDMDAMYSVAVNSYRANGGGNHMTVGTGLTQEDIRSRMTASTLRDLRYYLMQQIIEEGDIDPQSYRNWRFVPDEWAVPALRRDSMLLFPAAR